MKDIIFILIPFIALSQDIEQKTTYTYDNLNRLETVTYPNGYQTTYTYDELGNRLSAQTIDSYQNLPNIELSVAATGVSCIGKENGSIYLAAQDTSYEYYFNINRYVDGQAVGPNIPPDILGADKNWEFEYDNLAPGDYIINIAITTIARDLYNKNYIVRVLEPAPLLVSAKQLNNKVQLEMVGGTPPFSIAVNDNAVITTGERNIELLVNPNDVVSVQTEKLCEGTFSKKIKGDTNTLIFPNPVKNKVNIMLDNSIDNGLYVLIKLYNATGKYVGKQNPQVKNNTVVVSMDAMNTGAYYISIPAINQSFKIIKE